MVKGGERGNARIDDGRQAGFIGFVSAICFSKFSVGIANVRVDIKKRTLCTVPR